MHLSRAQANSSNKNDFRVVRVQSLRTFVRLEDANCKQADLCDRVILWLWCISDVGRGSMRNPSSRTYRRSFKNSDSCLYGKQGLSNLAVLSFYTSLYTSSTFPLDFRFIRSSLFSIRTFTLEGKFHYYFISFFFFHLR